MKTRLALIATFSCAAMAGQAFCSPLIYHCSGISRPVGTLYLSRIFAFDPPSNWIPNQDKMLASKFYEFLGQPPILTLTCSSADSVTIASDQDESLVRNLLARDSNTIVKRTDWPPPN
jgi:hypothetical protein